MLFAKCIELQELVKENRKTPSEELKKKIEELKKEIDIILEMDYSSH